jgi:hypothetical protein
METNDPVGIVKSHDEEVSIIQQIEPSGTFAGQRIFRAQEFANVPAAGSQRDIPPELFQFLAFG